jgi:PAS domain S-box-containing protein
MGLRSRVHPEDLSRIVFTLRSDSLTTDKSFEYEYRLKDCAGAWHWILDHCWVVERETDGRARKLMGVSMDITKRKELESELERKGRMLREVLDQSPQQIYARDSSGSFFLINRACADFYGTSPENLIGASLASLHPVAAEAKRLLAEELHVIKTGESIEIPELRLTRPNGTVVSLDLTLVPFDVPGLPERVALGFGLDITEKVRAERTLAAERDRLSVTLRSLGEGVISTDTDGRILLMNRGAQAITGWEEREAIGRPVGEVYKIRYGLGTVPVAEPTREIVENRAIVSMSEDAYLECKDGSMREVIDRGEPIIDQDGQVSGAVLVFLDITERRALEREMQRAQRAESIGVLAGGIAHDFNNILMAVLGNISLAKLNVSEEDENWGILSEAEKAVLQAKRLTSQLSLLAKGGAAPARERINLEEALEEACSINLRGSSVNCKRRLAPDLWPIDADLAQIMQVFQNLVVNAKESMPDGGLLAVSAENERIGPGKKAGLPVGNYVRIDVTDQGAGVSPDIAQRIFEPYFSTKKRGSGLGLTVSFAVAKNHGGTITLQSELGKGSTFSLYLPASSADTRQ